MRKIAIKLKKFIGFIPQLRPLNTLQELAILAGFLMVAKGLLMIYPPLMWIICGIWLMLPAKRVR